MDLITQFAGLEQRTVDSSRYVKAAATESRQQLEQRIGETEEGLDTAPQGARGEAGMAAIPRQSKWTQMRADVSAKMEDVKAKIDQRSDQIDADMARVDAEFAEAEAYDAIEFAEWVVDSARLAVLNALDARAFASERARAASGR
jgi:glycerol-3-phosphate dehydrogenase